ncbi:amino acid adenylation domain-containing protein [Chitinophagaceae bacterium DXS]|nr:amino acid adenylation domain-containing protein [Chitinophagaceae bacterium DXS]
MSWRILLEDLEELLTSLSHGVPAILQGKSSSYRQWYNALREYGQSDQLQQQLPYWEKAGSYKSHIPVDTGYNEAVCIKDTIVHTVEMPADQTRSLLQDAPLAYHTRVDDLLLCALALTVRAWSKAEEVLIGLEGHGREAIAKDVDISRTVGWFTSLYPVLLQVGNKREGAAIRQVKEQLRHVPAKGIGYGVLKYINKELSLQGSAPWEIVFNYLGQLDNITKNKGLAIADESPGAGINGEHRVYEKLSVNSFVLNGKLILNWTYSSKHYQEQTVRGLASAYLNQLQLLVTHCLEQAKYGSVYTPSDYGLGSVISCEELDNFWEGCRKAGRSASSLYRLSGLQEGILFHSIYAEGVSVYINQLGCYLTHPDIAMFRKSWQYVLRRHSILRSGFYYESFSVPVQCVYTDVQLPLELLDYSQLCKEDQDAAIRQYSKEDRQRGFDVESAPLMRMCLINLGAGRYYMLWTVHHLILDGWSTSILMEEFMKFYEQLSSGMAIEEKPEDRYEDYIHYLESRDQQAEQLYWRQYLENTAQHTQLPFIGSSIRRTKGAGEYKEEEIALDEAATAVIQGYARQHHITVNTLMQGVWASLLHCYTGSSDVMYGVTVSGRPAELPGMEQRVGMYINTLPLRSRMDGEEHIVDWLQQLQEEQLTSRQHQYSSLNDIRHWTGLQGDLFDTLLVFENYPVSKVLSSRQWHLQAEEIMVEEQTNYPLTIVIGSTDQIHIRFCYNATLLDPEYAKRISAHFRQVLLQVAGKKVDKLSDLDLLSSSEKHQLLYAFNNTEVAYPEDKTIIDLFEAQVEKTPGNIAVVFEEEALTYQQLNERSNQLAWYLGSKGVKEETLVPVCIERGLAMIIGILGILKAGGAYVPIDPEYPQERIKYMLQDTAAEIIVCNEECRKKLQSATTVDTIAIDLEWSLISQCPLQYPTINLTSNNLAYVIYTSGSTGKPKGVMIEHRAIVNRLLWTKDYFKLTSRDAVLQKTSFCFDVSVWELLCPVITGAKLVFAKPDGHKDNDYLKQIITNQKITVLHFVPSMLGVFLADMQTGECIGLEKVLCSGEALKSSHIKIFAEKLPRAALYNLYGPTEAAVDVTCWSIPKNNNDIQLVSIGKPISNVRIYILDNHGNLLPAGVKGEICIAGIQVARGYLNRPELTVKNFVADAFSQKTQTKIYKTGDYGRWLPDGHIEFLGRMDNQVKMNGYRIELGEIENVLLESAFINECVVVANEDEQNHKQLVAYITVGKTFDREAIVSYLQSRLPAYMVPHFLIELKTLPLTTNGKIDKKALPDVQGQILSGYEYVAPGNEIEEKLAEIWQELLGKKTVGIHDNFFELGGDSIISMQVVSGVRRLGYDLAPKDLFIYRTIAGLSGALLQRRKIRMNTGEQGLLTGKSKLLPIQRRYLEKDAVTVSHFNQSVLLSLSKDINAQMLERALTELLRQHDSLRFCYYQTENGWEQEYGNYEVKLLVEDLSDVSTDLLEPLVRNCADNYQHNLSMEKGELMKVVLIETPANQLCNRLLIIIHHLVIDGVSWRIILEDLERMLDALYDGRSIVAPLKGSSYRQWSEGLAAYGQTNALKAQKDYWQKIHNSYVPLPEDCYGKDNGVVTDNIACYENKLAASATQQLLQEVPPVYHTEINDILLLSLACALASWSKKEKIFIGLEGHGREDAVINGMDISRTTGWFTTLYPVMLEIDLQKQPGELVKDVKEQLRTIPVKGLGYGVLKYINNDPALQGFEPWDIVFNYLGQLDKIINKSRWLSVAHESRGMEISETLVTDNKLSVVVAVNEEQMQWSWIYSKQHYKEETIKSLAETCLMYLNNFIEHCIRQGRIRLTHTPSDYGLTSEISYKELDEFISDDDDETIMRF